MNAPAAQFCCKQIACNHAAMQMRFRPAMKSGAAVAFWMSLDVEFNLRYLTAAQETAARRRRFALS